MVLMLEAMDMVFNQNMPTSTNISLVSLRPVSVYDITVLPGIEPRHLATLTLPCPDHHEVLPILSLFQPL